MPILRFLVVFYAAALFASAAGVAADRNRLRAIFTASPTFERKRYCCSYDVGLRVVGSAFVPTPEDKESVCEEWYPAVAVLQSHPPKAIRMGCFIDDPKEEEEQPTCPIAVTEEDKETLVRWRDSGVFEALLVGDKDLFRRAAERIREENGDANWRQVMEADMDRYVRMTERLREKKTRGSSRPDA